METLYPSIFTAIFLGRFINLLFPSFYRNKKDNKASEFLQP
ncbi:hypothetical protein RINTHH_2940 [Richelia intracellularis HH01]|uniref:Uncharacterized protein n=1 Tax=Richelia intracellularis HH01 TaxID=1165094 RepID=M1WQL3_9NOST|nr:hypothetical protein RINTHH_2940 [Richelia intracellularis HH01]